MSDSLLNAYRQSTEPSPVEVERLLRAVKEGNAATLAGDSSPMLWRRWLWIPGLGLPSALALASALLWWRLQPPPDVPIGRMELSTAGIALPPGLNLNVTGEGSLEGSSLHPRLQWERGSIRVEVDPSAGLDVAVSTREGELRVVGTIFTVNRDALGTAVSVERGHVAVRCLSAAGVEEQVLGGESTLCLPTTAGGLLGRARALEDQSAEAAAVLEAVEAGLRMAEPGAAVDSELRYLRIDALHRSERNAEALVAADQFLVSGDKLRRLEVLRLAVEISQQQGGCTKAAPYLAQIAVEGSPTDEPLLTLCPRP